MRFRRGSQEAFCRIYEKYRDDLLRLAVSLLKDKSAAEDVVQEVFLTLIGTGLLRLGGHRDGLALGDVIESMPRVPWVRVATTIEGPLESPEKGVTEQWESFDRRIFASIEPDGAITYRDYGAKTMSVYHPQTNRLTIDPTADSFNLELPGSPTAAIEMIDDPLAREGRSTGHVQDHRS